MTPDLHLLQPHRLTLDLVRRRRRRDKRSTSIIATAANFRFHLCHTTNVDHLYRPRLILEHQSFCRCRLSSSSGAPRLFLLVGVGTPRRPCPPSPAATTGHQSIIHILDIADRRRGQTIEELLHQPPLPRLMLVGEVPKAATFRWTTEQ